MYCNCCNYWARNFSSLFTLEHYLLGNGLISNKQYGFINGRATSLQLLHMSDKWTEYLEDGGQIDALYSDFEKAFDKFLIPD